MTTTIDLTDSSYQLSDLLALVRRGDDVILEEGNTPVARLVPMQPEKSPEKQELVLGTFAGDVWISDDFNDELPMEFWLGDDA